MDSSVRETDASASAPTIGTVERWCFDLITTRELGQKLRPRPVPAVDRESNWEPSPAVLRIDSPGRPPELRVATRATRMPRSLASSAARARILHTFLHHELQAAELFAWALLAFPETPRPFREGLLRLCREELAHLWLYAEHLRELGSEIGEFPVRDWFWERVKTCTSPASFVALQGLGLEGANLDHSVRFAAQFREAGDVAGARIIECIEQDEIGHVRFAVKWFERLTGRALDYETFREMLPEPLTPAVLQGTPLNRRSRLLAGLDETFLDQLAAEPPTNARGKR